MTFRHNARASYSFDDNNSVPNQLRLELDAVQFHAALVSALRVALRKPIFRRQPCCTSARAIAKHFQCSVQLWTDPEKEIATYLNIKAASAADTDNVFQRCTCDKGGWKLLNLDQFPEKLSRI